MSIFYKWMLVLSVPYPVFYIMLDLEFLHISGFGLAHGGGGLFVLLFILSAIVFIISLILQCILVLLHFTRYKTKAPINVILVVLAYQTFQISIFIFSGGLFTPFREINILFFISVAVYVFKFFSSEKDESMGSG